MNGILQKRLADKRFVVAPGVADTLSACMAARAGFEAVFVSGSALAYSHLARPDIGLLSLGEVADITRRISERVDIAVLVDADSGFGNAFQVYRTVRTLELAGANAIQIEDQESEKDPGNVTGRPLISEADMVVKINAALDARRDETTLISARTDAAITKSVSEALDRAARYADAGADIVFVEGLEASSDRSRLINRLGDKTPSLFNLGWPGKPKSPTVDELVATGYAIALDPSIVLRAVVDGVGKALQILASHSKQSIAPQPTPEEAIDAQAYLRKYETWRANDTD